MRLVRIVAMFAVVMMATLALTGTSSAATCAGSGYLSTSTGTLQRFSLVTNAVTTTTSTFGAHFDDIAVSPNGRTLYAVDSLADTIRIFDATTGIATATISGFSRPTAIAMSPDGTRAYVANQTARTVTVLETTANSIVATFSVSLVSAPTDLAVSADGSLVYVTVGDVLQARSTTDGTLQKTYALAGGDARAVALSATQAYTAVLTPFYAIESALLSGSTSGMLYGGIVDQPRSIAISPDGATLYVGTVAHNVRSLLAATIGSGTLSPVGTVSSSGVVSIAVTPDSATIYSASPTEVAVLPRGTSTPTTLAGAVTSDITAVAVCPAVTEPGAPTAATADPGDAVVSLSWTAPANNGGAPITSYTATAAAGGTTCSTTGATTCLVTGLKNGTPYSFTVTATNAGGTSAASATSLKVTPRRDNSARVLTVGLPTISFTKQGIGITTTFTVTGAGTIAQVASYKGDRFCSLSRPVVTVGSYRVRCIIKTAGRILARTRAVSYTLRSTFSPRNGLLAASSQLALVPRRR